MRKVTQKHRTYIAPSKKLKDHPMGTNPSPIQKRVPIRKRTKLPDNIGTGGKKDNYCKYNGGETNKKAFHYALLGAEEYVIAKFLGIESETLKVWRKKYPLLDQAITEGMEYACANVVHSLYQRALGFEYEEKEYRSCAVDNVDAETGKTETVYEMRLAKVVRKHFPADISAIKYFLYNRTKHLPAAQQWTNERQEITGKDGEPLMLNGEQQSSNDEKARKTREAMLLSLNGGGGK